VLAGAVGVAAVPAGPPTKEPRFRAVRAVADAYVAESSSHTNFGYGTSLRLDASPLARAFVLFRTKYLYRGDVRQVNLLVYSRSGTRLGFRVRLVTAPWRESRITFANAPRMSSRFIASGPIRRRSWKAVDVTPLVDYDDAEVSFALTTLAPNGLELASRETGLTGPRLVIELESEDDGAALPRTATD
jgi:hypothetical protein